ncbi:DUF5696 domain-containing protein [Sutcliffiella rhizosphaerae]|uniref:Uncharacterized protein n=1 Tax=Sutcliffiella rhizosphaerae TaxID=2880967 RepID=A0ABM8YLN8_9BACI|nr:DUF5696 domain-containing protein [Sutcliffiella rhizosphaerae]CAG9620787.1 hypothetical protein BACCIP111883_01558 [Sutcliffiella rhizosphaerae]
MYKKLFLILLIAIIPIHALAESLTTTEELEEIEVETELGEETLRFDSNQFTQPEKENKPLPEGTLEGFTLVTENDQLALYVQEESLALKIQNKETDYIWNSGLDNSENYRLNNTWTDMVQSAVTIDYLDRRGNLKTESILTEDSKPEIQMHENGFTAKIKFKTASIDVELSVTLEEDNIIIDVPSGGVEDGTYNKIVSMKVYPFLGAAHMDDISGYLFIPDGSGALMRFERSAYRSDTPFIGAIYGEDEGFSRPKSSEDEFTFPAQAISVPVYGAVHGVKQNAFLTSIEEGQSYGQVLAYPSGASTDFFWVTSEYQYRFNYFQPTSKSMGGFNVYQPEKNDFNIKQKVMFLQGEEADYVGMANRYQQHLEAQQILEKNNQDVMDIRLEFLGGETKKGLIWNSVLPMTPLQDIPEFVDELQQNNVDNMHIVYRGWTKGGLTGTLPQKFPIERKLGGKGDLEDTIALLSEKNIPFYLHSDFTTAFDGASGFSGSKDVAKKINSQPITKNQFGYGSNYLSPKKSLEMAKKDLVDFLDHGVTNIALETTGNKLFSDFNRGLSSSREEMINIYQELFTLYQEGESELSFYRPNNYAWEYMERYLDMPMYSSNYMFVTDTVPFLQIVLKGYVPFYANFSNFSHNPKEEVLRMIEFGAYPSFYLTSESAQLLMKTPSRGLYTSEFDIWKEEVINQYTMVKESLGTVENASISDRVVHQPGVSEVVYDNGVTIIVNYTDADVTINGQTIEATSFEVSERGN